MYILHDKQGNITGVVQGPDDSYGRMLTEYGHEWFFCAGEIPVEIIDAYVEIGAQSKQLKKKSFAPIACDRKTISCGNEVSTISRIPIGSVVTIESGDFTLHSATITDSKMEIGSDVPDTLIVTVTPPDAKYHPAKITIRAR